MPPNNPACEPWSVAVIGTLPASSPSTALVTTVFNFCLFASTFPSITSAELPFGESTITIDAAFPSRAAMFA